MRTNIPITLDAQPLPPSVTDPDGAILSRPVQEPDIERAGGPHSHHLYDIV